MTELYLIRHVQAEGNVYRMMQGFWDGGVTAEGRRQQQVLRERFESLPVDRVYASDLFRARFTAEAVAQPKGLPVLTDARLREIDVGDWTGRFFGNVMHDEPLSAHDFMYNAGQWRKDGAETYAQVGERVYAALSEIAAANEGKRVAVVSHGVSIRCFASKVTGISLDDTKALPIFGNISVSTFRWENGVFLPIELNSGTLAGQKTVSLFGKTADLRHEYIDPLRERKYYERCYADAWLFAHGSLDGYDPATYLKCACAHCLTDRRALMKLYVGEEAAGLIDLDTERGKGEGIGWISLLYLNENFRGKGYGIQALARPIMLYRALGRKELRLHAAEDNTRALRFYDRCGFETLRRDGHRLLLLRKELL